MNDPCDNHDGAYDPKPEKSTMNNASYNADRLSAIKALAEKCTEEGVDFATLPAEALFMLAYDAGFINGIRECRNILAKRVESV